jgi:hypothetical protein
MSYTNSFVFAIAGSVAVQHMTVMEGETLTIKCHIRNAHRSHVEWKNPNGHVMFFNDHKGEDIIIPHIDVHFILYTETKQYLNLNVDWKPTK